MTRFQKIIAVVIVVELASLGAVWRLNFRAALLPPINWRACLIEDAVANEIRAQERRIQPDQPASWMELGAAYRAFGLFPQAEYCYRRVNRLAPKDRSYLYYWAECFDLMGQTQAATKRYLQIVKEGLPSPLGSKTTQYCWLNIGQDRLREENVPLAIEALNKALELPKAKFLLARVLIRTARMKEALALLDDLLREFPDMVEYNQMRSWAEAQLGNQDAAQEFYERSLRSRQLLSKWDPTYQEAVQRRKTMGSQAWHEKSLELEAQGRLLEALDWSRKATDTFWAEDRAQELAKLQLLTGHPGEASATAEECIRRVGASAKTLDIIGVASVQIGDRNKAQRVWEQAIELEPTSDLYWKLAELQKLAGSADQRRKYQALEQYQIGREAWFKNDLRAALEHFEKGVALADGLPQLWFYLAETRRFLGDAQGAEAAYRRCLQINPDHGRALHGLERLQRTTGK